MKILDLINDFLFYNYQEVTEETVDYYEENPDELDLIINKEYFHATYLGLFFILGLALTMIARIIRYFYGDFLGDFVNIVILDVTSEIGIAVFGGAMVAYLIEFLNKRQYQQNLKFRREIKVRLEKRKKASKTSGE